MVDGQVNCDWTNWVFTDSRSEDVDLVIRGKIVERDKAKSDRLNVTKNCSLVTKNVTVQDVGLYHCQQLKPGQEVADTQIELSVINSEYLHPYIFRSNCLAWFDFQSHSQIITVS